MSRNDNFFDPKQLEKKWSSFWKEKGIYKTDLRGAKKPFYNLMMFPYPSAEGLHVGNVYTFTGVDVYGRYMRMKGFDVFEPIGFDSGGIHSENYAIKIGVHPKIQISKNVRNFTRQLKKIGCMYDWEHTVDAMDPAYYRWTQWIFIQLFKAGLAYKKKASVTWCSSCKTTLSDEQTEEKKGLKVCERCGTEVEKKELNQWFFRITKYADRLLKNTYKLDWPEKILLAQRNWIGKSEGAEIRFKVQGSRFKVQEKKSGNQDSELKSKDKNFQFSISAFTTRPDTLWGCTFFCIAPEHEFVARLLKLKALGPRSKVKISDYIKRARNKSEMERKAEDKEKTGVNTGLFVVNPVNKEKIPLFIADYVLMDYGEGAVMGVPGHDLRDYRFAKKYGLPLKTVIVKNNDYNNYKHYNDYKMTCYEGDGVLVNSGSWDGWQYPQDLPKIIDWLERKKIGKRTTTYKLRDWCISRQRYWGPPIPMIFCQKCGWQAVEEKDLPVLLPDTDDYLPGEAGGKPPLARVPEFIEEKCPVCGNKAKRESDVSDTFLDSSWYFLAYPNTGTEEYKAVIASASEAISSGIAASPRLSGAPRNDKLNPFNKDLTRKWLPVSQYVGGAEHSVLHLLYSRFITMALHDLEYLDFEEPFPHFYAHGLMIKDGAKMSKSRGNIISPDEYIAEFGTDTLRAYLRFLGPFDMGGDFRDTGMAGMYRFLAKIYRFCQKRFEVRGSRFEAEEEFVSKKEGYWANRTVKKVGEDYSRFKYNTAIAAIMKYVNFLSSQKDVSLKALRLLILIMAPLTPYLAEELWSLSNGSMNQSVHLQKWPEYDKELVKEDLVTIVVQVNGKIKDKFEVPTFALGASHRLIQPRLPRDASAGKQNLK